MAPPKLPASISPLDASSYHHPDGGKVYAPLRAAVIKTATDMGYDVATMSEHGVVWADDQDPFGHVLGAAYPHWGAVTNFRLFESFAEQLGNKYDDLFKARGIGVMTKSYETNLKRPVSYPDSVRHLHLPYRTLVPDTLFADCGTQVIVAVRIAEVLPDRYFAITSMWSLRQQAIVAQTRGYVVFFDYAKSKPANLVEAGGVYAKLHAALTERAERSSKLAAEWESKNSKPARSKKPKL